MGTGTVLGQLLLTAGLHLTKKNCFIGVSVYSDQGLFSFLVLAMNEIPSLFGCHHTAVG
jgi:hypothetical protein